MAKSHNLDSASRPTNTPRLRVGRCSFQPNAEGRNARFPLPKKYPRLRVGGFCSFQPNAKEDNASLPHCRRPREAARGTSAKAFAARGNGSMNTPGFESGDGSFQPNTKEEMPPLPHCRRPREAARGTSARCPSLPRQTITGSQWLERSAYQNGTANRYDLSMGRSIRRLTLWSVTAEAERRWCERELRS